MKKLLSLVMAMVLVLSLSAPALAQSSVASSYDLESRELWLNERAGVMGMRKEDGTYVLLNAEGRELTSKRYITMKNNNQYFEVATDEGVNVLGLIDGAGNEMVPMSYGDVEYISDRWQVGAKLVEATVDNYDYKSFSGDGFWLVEAYDFYYQGAKVGSLGRTEYASAYGYGAYLYLRDKEGNYSYYDSAFNKSAYPENDSSSEYVENYKDHSVWHRGSNQQAFTAGCTLTPEDVNVSIYHINNQFFDLQGNLLFNGANPYDHVERFVGDYARVKAFGKYGLIDRSGKEVVPCLYDSIYSVDSYEYLPGGYQMVVKDGKAGFVNAAGQETTEFKYSDSVVRDSGSFARLEDLEGNLIVISAAAGQLPDTYEEVHTSMSTAGCPLLVVENANEQAGVIDLYGNEVIPLDGTYDDSYDLTVSKDGTLALGYKGNRVYTVYRIELGEAPVAEAPAADEPAAGEPAAEGWTCASCETQNSGKFCTECGAARPEETAANVCVSCEAEFAEGETPKFCPECGAKQGE